MLEIGLPALPGVPSRAILLWPLDFTPAIYPQLTGYVLCNGLNGTPDMRGITPRGTPAAAVVLATGGAATHTHGAGTFATPAHNHTSPVHTHTDGGHTHTIDDHDHCIPDHNHSIPDHTHNPDLYARDYCPVGNCSALYDVGIDACTGLVTNQCTGQSTATTTISANSGNADITGTAAGILNCGALNIGGLSAAGDSWPPWMNLNFIMRL